MNGGCSEWRRIRPAYKRHSIWPRRFSSQVAAFFSYLSPKLLQSLFPALGTSVECPYASYHEKTRTQKTTRRHRQSSSFQERPKLRFWVLLLCPSRRPAKKRMPLPFGWGAEEGPETALSQRSLRHLPCRSCLSQGANSPDTAMSGMDEKLLPSALSGG